MTVEQNNSTKLYLHFAPPWSQPEGRCATIKASQERHNEEKENSPARTKGPAQLKEIL